MTNVDKLIAMLAKSNRTFFHFTDRRNLPSIRENGLRSMKSMLDSGITPVAPGGNEWSIEADRQKGMNEYVYLCFLDDHPMHYLAKSDGRIDESIYLLISPEVLRLPGVMMTDGVSNKSEISPISPEDLIPRLDFEVMYKRTDWKDPEIQLRLKAARLHEILVPEVVPLNLIRNMPKF